MAVEEALLGENMSGRGEFEVVLRCIPQGKIRVLKQGEDDLRIDQEA